MNKTLGKLFLTSIVFLLVFSIFGQAQDPVRTDVTPSQQGPECSDSDKGRCQAVCNIQRSSNGTPNPAGGVNAFSSLVSQGSGVLCAKGEQPTLVGCDLPSDKQCINAQGLQGVWQNCYYKCIEAP